MKTMAFVAINRELRLRCNKKSGAVSPGLRRPYSIESASKCNAGTTKREGMNHQEYSRHNVGLRDITKETGMQWRGGGPTHPVEH